MEKKYVVEIQSSLAGEEDFEKDEKNLIKIKVFDKNGNILNKDLYCIQIEFNKEGALGLGNELIRAAFNKPFDKEYHKHLTPIQDGKATQNMGVALTHDSPELVIVFAELGNIPNEIEKSKTINTNLTF